MPKRRSKKQVLQDASEARLKEALSEWIVNQLNKDYGYDFEVRISERCDSKTQNVSSESFYIQLKATINSNEAMLMDLRREDLELYVGSDLPVVLIKEDSSNKIFYWELAQPYIWDVLSKEDSDWRRKKSKRIKLTNKLSDLNFLKKNLMSCRSRILRHNILSLGIGEGIDVREDLSTLSQHKKKSLEDYKVASLLQAYKAHQSGDIEKARQSMYDAYKAPEDDIGKLTAIISIIGTLNIAVSEQNEKFFNFCNEGIKLAEALKRLDLAKYLLIRRGEALILVLLNRITALLLVKNIGKMQQEQLLSFFCEEELQKLIKMESVIIKEINASLEYLLENNYIYVYLNCLPTLLSIRSLHILNIAQFDKGIIKEISDDALILQMKRIADYAKQKDVDLAKIVIRSLANYYYCSLNHGKAIEYMNELISFNRIDGDTLSLENNLRLLKTMKEKPDPYEHDNIDDGNLSTEEYKQQMRNAFIELRLVDFNTNDAITTSIEVALNDLDPSNYFRFCDNLHIKYLSTSPLGRSLAIPSLGTKVIWCKYGKPCLGESLDDIFTRFKEDNCLNCKHCSPRMKDWFCSIRWVGAQEKDPEFQQFIERLKINLK
ncbi:MAG: DUF4365 domain-containing protein [Candidatus Micrarchaeia archaeon]